MRLDRRFVAASEGATSIEYALVAFLMAIAIAMPLTESRDHLIKLFADVSSGFR